MTINEEIRVYPLPLSLPPVSVTFHEEFALRGLSDRDR